MALSSNSVIHYTHNLTSLVSILKDGFQAKYCYEKIYAGSKFLHGGHPMVCFCDIPLYQLTDHINSYGKYGIGLNKHWAKRKGLNPVLYFDSESYISHFLQDTFNKLIDNEDWNEDSFDILVRLLAYSKNYQYDLLRGGKIVKDYRFYNEREWRYVLTLADRKGAPQWLDISEIKAKKSEFNKQISEYRLKFECDDISYIIVDTAKDITIVVDELRDHFSISKKDSSILNILFTKILTIEQIQQDF